MTFTRSLFRCFGSLALAACAAVAHAGSDVRSPCSLSPASDELVSDAADGRTLALAAHKPHALANWSVRWHQRERLWITLAETNRGDAPATIQAAFATDLQPDGASTSGLAAPPRTLAAHASVTERLSLYVPDDATTVAVQLHALSPGATVAATLAVECSDRRFDPGEMTRPAAALLDEALKLYSAGAADPIPNARQAIETVRVQASGAQDASDIAWAMRYLMISLHDFHSEIRPAGEPEAAAPAVAPVRPATVEMHDGIATLRLSTVGVTTEAELLDYAARLHEMFATTTAARRPLGWIVDLRGYGGGDMWAALAGLGPLLQGPAVGAFVVHDGRQEWIVERGAVRVAGGKAILDLQLPPEPPFRGPVAVLIGPSTAGAGEAVAIAFEGRPKTRFFGASTQGRDDSALVAHKLSDGTLLNLLGSRNADRNGVVYRGPIEPDKASPADDDSAPAREAAAWLQEQH